jgi:hypothetical protein
MRIKSAPAAATPYPRYAACDSIANYGSRGDGTGDDAVALQRAINSVGSGCSIFFPPGVYRLASDVVVNKDITLQLGPQVEIRQLARLKPDVSASRSLTIQGEGPATSVWRQGIPYPFWNGATNGPRFKDLRFVNMEFNPLSAVSFVYYIGGSSNLLEMVSVTCSRGDGSGAQFAVFTLADNNPGGNTRVAAAQLNVLRDVTISGIRMDLLASGTDLQITRLTAFLTDSADSRIRVTRTTGSGQSSLSSVSLNVGFVSGGLADLIQLRSDISANLSVSLNDVEIRTDSHCSAIYAEAASSSGLNLLVNALRFTTFSSASTGYAVKTVDSASSIMRAVLAGCFFRSVTARTDAAIQGTLVNSNSLRTLAGVDQRGWASLT